MCLYLGSFDGSVLIQKDGKYSSLGYWYNNRYYSIHDINIIEITRVDVYKDILSLTYNKLEEIRIHTRIGVEIITFLKKNMHIKHLRIANEYDINIDVINIINNMDLDLLEIRYCRFVDCIYNLYKYIPCIILYHCDIDENDLNKMDTYVDVSFVDIPLSDMVKKLIGMYAHDMSHIHII